MTDYSASIRDAQPVFFPDREEGETALDSVIVSFRDYETPIYSSPVDAPFGDGEIEPFYEDDGYFDWRDDPYFVEDTHDFNLHQATSRALYKSIIGFENEVSLEEYLKHPPILPNKFDFRKPIPSALRWAVFKRDGYLCVECLCDSDLTADHIIPVYLGGPTSSWNLRTLCRRCNSKKGAR